MCMTHHNRCALCGSGGKVRATTKIPRLSRMLSQLASTPLESVSRAVPQLSWVTTKQGHTWHLRAWHLTPAEPALP